MKNIGILYDTKVGFSRNKPFLGNRYNQDYSLLLKCAKRNKLNFFLASYHEYNNKKFKQAWIYTTKWQKIRNVKLDAILDKVDGDEAFFLKRKIDKQLPLINRYAFDLLCTDKWLLYKKWPKLIPQTFLGDKINNIKKIKSDLLIVKPRMGASGRGIYIIKKNEYKSVGNKYIVQGLIKGGNIFKHYGQHDFRVLIGNGQPIYSTVRVPKRKKYISNVGQGGQEFYYAPNKIPKNILRIVHRIDKDLKKYYPRLYSIDFMIDEKNKPLIIELNSRPGLTHYNKRIVKQKLDNLVCQMFKKI